MDVQGSDAARDVRAVEKAGTTLAKTQTLADLEAIIEVGLRTFVEVGGALLTIRDDRLYRTTYTTFEDYCRDRWGLSRKRAYDQIAAAETMRALSPMGDMPMPQLGPPWST